MTKRRMTEAQQYRQNARRENGQYDDALRCEACGNVAPYDHWSHPDASRTGQLLTLCGDDRCFGTTACTMFERIEDAVAYVRAMQDTQGFLRRA